MSGKVPGCGTMEGKWASDHLSLASPVAKPCPRRNTAPARVPRNNGFSREMDQAFAVSVANGVMLCGCIAALLAGARFTWLAS